jgi:S-adenosylmethionine hydrolase
MLEGLEPSPVAENTWRGTVLKTDRFGNLITNFRQNAFPALEDGNFELRAGRRRITRMHSNFSEGRAGGIFLTGGSSGFLEIVMNQDSAARALGSSAKLPLILKLL